MHKFTPSELRQLELKDFKKFDSGKLEYDMFPDNVLQDVVKIMMYGAYTKGYEKDNWKKCTDINRYYNALRRHTEAWKAGEYYDVESGQPHLAHALCNLVFMHYLEERKKSDAAKNDAS